MKMKKIKGYPNYFVTSDGNIYNIIRKRKMKTYLNISGYEMIQLCNKGEKKNIRVHRLIANSFIPNPFNKPQVNHIDEDKANNNVENLEWMTPSENVNYGNRNKIVGIANSKTKGYYSSKTTKRNNFKKICKKQGWRFEDFEEIDSGKKYRSNKKYYYIY